MIVGRGLIASQFIEEDREDVIFFASGVSNSSETRNEEFLREQNLIETTIEKYSDKLFIYFSTCSIYDSSKYNSSYVLHKLHMEEIIKEKSSKYLILRISNAVGKGGNPNLLMNYLVKELTAHNSINIHLKATRNLIDVEDIKKITLQLIEENHHNKIINLAYPSRYTIIELVELIEEYFNIKTQHQLINIGSGYDININEIEEYFMNNNQENKDLYIHKILQKYYS